MKSLLVCITLLLGNLNGGAQQIYQEGPDSVVITDRTEQTFFRNASFPGGTRALARYIASEVQYPRSLRANGIEGTIVIRFTIDQSGQPKGFEVIQSLDESSSRIVLDAFQRMPHWTPAIINGKAVESIKEVPIRFSLTI